MVRKGRSEQGRVKCHLNDQDRPGEDGDEHSGRFD